MAHRALGPATLAVVQAVEAALTPTDAVLVVACSGGADSLALAVATQQVCRRSGRSADALVVDHGLQDDSAAVADRARRALLGLGYAAAQVRRVEVDRASGSGLEAAARDVRYAALEHVAAARDATVLLGHTLDDQAETVLLGLARGSGTRSLAGMAARSGRWLRPLLGLRRSTTRQVCAELGLAPWDDPQNGDDSYTRSRTRSRVLPVLEEELGPGVAEALARTAELAREDADLLDALARQTHPDTDTLDCELLARTPAALRRRVLRTFLFARGASEVGYVHVRAVEELITGWHGQRGVDLPGVSVSRQNGRLVCDH